MKTRFVVLACCITMATTLAYAQMDEGYQMARITQFEKLASDAQHMTDTDQYKISMRLGGTVYYCRANESAATMSGWSMGKEFPAKLGDPKGKTLLVKSPSGQIVQMDVVGKKAPK